MFQVHISQPARADLSDAVDYIHEVLLAPIAAIDLIDEFEAKIQILSDNPFSCGLVNDVEFAKRGLRYVMVKNYVVFFTVSDRDRIVTVVRFLYGRRDWVSIFTQAMEKGG